MANSVSDALLPQGGKPGDPLLVANALLSQGHTQGAMKLLQDLVKTAPGRADAWYGLGQLHAAQGDFKPAVAAFKRVIQLAPLGLEAHVHLGNTYLRNGRIGQALEAYRNGLKHIPDSALLYFNLGIALRQSGDMDGGIASFRKAIELYPQYGQANFSLGNALRDSGQLDEAEAAYRRAIELEPAYADAHANLAALLVVRGNYAAAIESCLSVVQLVPGHPQALKNMSLALYKVGRFTEGAEVTFRALAVTPNDTMLQYHMGEMLYGLIREGNAPKAREFALRWQQVSPNDPVARHMAAAALGEQTPERAGDDYVRETFDRFSTDFETTLGNLGYRVPELICGTVTDALGGRTGLSILDAGCGTGLCAPFLKPLARHLVGVDLSGGMLAKAHDRSLYDALHQVELGAFLDATPDRYDVTVAADVFCYFGALEPSFRAIAARSQPQALLAFTVEAATGEAPAAGYRLGPTGRYQHDAAYVRQSLEQAGFSILRFDDTHGREEMGQPVPCFMVLAQLA
jgi:predicted TPR repeat methyltransferase